MVRTMIPAALAAAFLAVTLPAAAALFGGDKAETKEEGKSAEAKAPTIKETMGAVSQIAKDLKGIEAIEKRLATIEKNVAGIDASLVPVGNALKPESLRGLVDLASDVVFERAKSLLLLAAGLGAALIVLAAGLLRWSLASRRVSPSVPTPPKEAA